MLGTSNFTGPIDMEKLFKAADVDGDGSIGLQDATSFFAGALLPVDAMNAIWSATAPDGRAIRRETFQLALLLISAQQRGISPLTPAAALAAGALPPPQFIVLSDSDRVKYTATFQQAAATSFGMNKPAGQLLAMPPQTAGQLFSPWNLPAQTLNAIWRLSDRNGDGALSLPEFLIAIALVMHAGQGRQLPTTVPATLLYNLPPATYAQSPNVSPVMNISPEPASPRVNRMSASPAQSPARPYLAISPTGSLRMAQGPSSSSPLVTSAPSPIGTGSPSLFPESAESQKARAKLENEIATEKKTAKYVEQNVAAELAKERELRAQMAKLEADTRAIQERIAQIKAQEAGRQERSVNLAAERDMIGGQLATLQAQNNAMQQSIAANEEACRTAEKHVQDLESESRTLREQIEEAKKRHASAEQMATAPPAPTSSDDLLAKIQSVRMAASTERQSASTDATQARLNLSSANSNSLESFRNVMNSSQPAHITADDLFAN